MRFEAFDMKKLRTIGRGYNMCRNQQILQDFIDSGLDCAELKDFTHHDAKSCQSSLWNSMKRLGLNNSIAIISRENRVFLIRKITKE